MKYIKPIAIVAVLFLLAFLLERNEESLSNIPAFSVQAVVETHSSSPLADVDDPCIWVHPTDPEKSTVICTDKGRGLAVYDLQGEEIQFIAPGRINNVDLRSGFSFQDQKITIVAASNRTKNNILLFRVDPDTRHIEPLPSVPIKPGLLEVYGLCMYKNRAGQFYIFVTSVDGMVEQWEIFENLDGKIQGKRVRILRHATQAEGCVADDDLGFFYLAEEDKGIWKYYADPTGGQKGELIARVNTIFHPDLEGLTIYYGAEPGTGYLIVSCQGNDRYAILDRKDNNPLIAMFQIADGTAIDSTQKTDGIDVVRKNMGGRFPAGLFVAQDGKNSAGDLTNFKLVSFADVLAGLKQSARR